MGFLNKSKISKSISYYISEIIIITIGIFIAIQLNNYNESRKNESESIASLKRVSSDLKTEKFIMESYEKRFAKSKKYLVDVLYNRNEENLDSIAFHFFPFSHYKMNAEYVNLKYSGKLNLIKNDTLRYNIVNFYELYYSAFSEIAERHKKQINGNTTEYFENEFPTDTTNLINSTIVKQKLTDQKFRNIINEQILALDYIIRNMQTQRIDSLIKLIDNEIE